MKQDVSFKKDFFYYLLMAKDPETGDGFAPQELWEEAAVSEERLGWNLHSDSLKLSC